MFFVALIALFIMLRNGRSIASSFLTTADRLFGDPGEGLVEKMADAVRGTVNGTVVVAVAEGLLIGVAYVAAGVPNPLLFTVFTIAFAMLPFGAWAAFTAAALTLGIGGGSGLAAAVFAWGAVVMLTGDQLRLAHAGRRSRAVAILVRVRRHLRRPCHFGLLGLFLGPVIMAALLTVWREWVRPREPQTRHVVATEMNAKGGTHSSGHKGAVVR